MIIRDWHRVAPAALTASGMAGLAILSPIVAANAAQLSHTKFVLALIALVSALLIGLSGRSKQILLFLYVVSISYNRQYYSFSWLHGDLGARGLYWCPSDLFLVLLVCQWLVRKLLGRQQLRGSSSTAGWLLPLLIVAATSTLASEEPLGSTMEMLRLCKLALLLLYLQFNLDPRSVVAVVAGLAAVIVVQAPIAVMQAAFGSGQGGLSEIFSISEPSQLAHRAAGTLGHPNFLAPYLLMVVPGFVAVALGCLGTRLGTLAGIVAAAGLVTLVLTQSRAPILLMGVAFALMIALLVGRRALTPLRAVGIVVLALVAATVAALPIGEAIYSRLTGDLGKSVDFRSDYNQAAIRMWEAQPLLGLGPNNFTLDLRHYDPSLGFVNELLKVEGAQANLRSTAPVHNVYLLVLSELGLLGLIAFGTLLGRSVVLAWRASALIPSPAGLLAAGLCCGLLAQLAQQFVDYSLWSDPVLFTLALLLGLCAHFGSYHDA